MTDADYANEVKALNTCFASLLALREKSDLERLPALDAASQPLINTNIAVFLAPAVGEMFLTSDMRAEVSLLATECLVAMRRWQLDRKTSLADLKTVLAPAGISQVPIDPFSGKPLGSTTINGNPAVYSVGPDLKDDGGRPIVPGDPEQKGDFVFRLSAVKQ
jgi:hypothetical protein